MYYIKKIFRMLLSIFSIGTFSFLLLELIPGEPETTILGIEASAKDLENLREQLGLNLSFGTRYWNWLCGVFQGDLGISFKYKELIIAKYLAGGLSSNVISLYLEEWRVSGWKNSFYFIIRIAWYKIKKIFR